MKNIVFILTLVSVSIMSCSRHEKRETKYPNGKPREMFEVIETSDGSFIKDGEYRTWYPGDKPAVSGTYKQGKKEGEWKELFPSGQVGVQSNYKADTLDGSYHSWYQNGHNKLQCQYSNGKMTGHIQSWFENGQMEYDFSVDSKANYQGNARQWYANGKMKKDANYNEKGSKVGTQKYWYANGQKMSEEAYVDNQISGSRYIWDDNGSLIVRREFKDGKDTNLPATYKRKSGEKLELKKDDSYELYYQSQAYFGKGPWKTIKGNFSIDVVDGEIRLKLDDFINNRLVKFNKDSIVYQNSFRTNIIYVRAKENAN